MKKRIGQILLCLLSATTAMADNQNPVVLDEMIVTATKSERAVDSVPASVTVISKDEIKSMPGNNADELLRNLAGVYTRHSTGFNTSSTNNNVRMRGLGGTGEAYVQVLVDGVPVNDTQTGGVEWNEFPVQDIERIEIVRGPASALYGSNALGGVINIITRKPEAGFHTEASLGYGSLKTKDFGLRHSGTVGKFSYAVGATGLFSDGYVEIPPDQLTPTNNADKDTERSNLTAKMMYAVNPDTAVTYTGSYLRNRQTGKYSLIDNFNCFTEDIMRSSLNLSTKAGSADIKATVYGSDARTTYENAYATKGPKYQTFADYEKRGYFGDVGATVQVGMGLGQHNFLTVGTDYRSACLDAVYDYVPPDKQSRNGGKQAAMALFIQDEVSLLSDNLIMNLGGRYDWLTSYDGYKLDTSISPLENEFERENNSAFSPKLAVLYKLNKGISLRTAVGQAFKTPDLNKVYRGTYTINSKTTISNPDLEPETLTSYEFGADFNINDIITIRSTYYHEEIKDCIVDKTIAKNTYEYQNAGKVIVDGLETEAEARITDSFRLMGELSWNRSKIDKWGTNTESEGNYMSSMPKLTWSVGLVYDNPRILTARLTGRRVGVIYDDDLNTKEAGRYFVADLMLSRKLTKNWEATLEVLDLFDEEYQDVTSLISPGRVVMSTIKYSF